MLNLFVRYSMISLRSTQHLNPSDCLIAMYQVAHSGCCRRRVAAALFLGFTLISWAGTGNDASAQTVSENTYAVKGWLPLSKKGDAIAQFNIGNRYARGDGVSKDYYEAMRWYRRAAELNLSAAQFELGKFYDKGRGVTPDDAKAVFWYHKAAKAGHAAAQANLGLMYSQGRSVPGNSSRAALWFLRSAKQGNATGQVNLGLSYLYGDGLPQNTSKAVHWLRKAAEQGEHLAQFHMGTFFRIGKGVPKDPVLAFFWWDLSSATAPLLGKLRYLAISERDRVAKTLSSEQLEKAQALVLKWRRQHPDLRLPQPKPLPVREVSSQLEPQ